jgi:hypothetical protein
MKNLLFYAGIFLITANLQAQNDTSQSTFWHPQPRNYSILGEFFTFSQVCIYT